MWWDAGFFLGGGTPCLRPMGEERWSQLKARSFSGIAKVKTASNILKKLYFLSKMTVFSLIETIYQISPSDCSRHPGSCSLKTQLDYKSTAGRLGYAACKVSNVGMHSLRVEQSFETSWGLLGWVWKSFQYHTVDRLDFWIADDRTDVLQSLHTYRIV